MSSSTPLSAACTTIALSLYKQLTENNGTGNVFYSPIGISSALAMVLLGARGNTAAQMAQCLCIQRVKGDVHVDFCQLLSGLNKTGTTYTFSVANRLYGDHSYQFISEFIKASKKHYNVALGAVDFKTKAETVRVDINRWVGTQTKDQIKDLLAAGVVDEMTRLVLVNAIYFKGLWDKPFKTTTDHQFRINKTETKPVMMMYKNARFPLRLIPDINCQVLELPYTGRHMSMIILLPVEMEDDTTGLEKLEKALTYRNFVDWTNPRALDEVKIQLALPRFKMEQTYDMNEVLTKMGMVDAFDTEKSDFSGMSPAEDLALSKVVHKAVVEVNEEGTKAAATTTATAVKDGTEMTPFVADHPFLFFIRHNPSMTILFAGRYCSP